MAGERVLFRTEQGDAVALPPVLHPRQAALKRCGGGEAGVLDLAGGIAGGIGGPCPEFAEMDIGDVVLGQSVLQAVPVELGMAAAVGHGADIGDGGDAVLREQGEHVRQGVGRMTQRVQGRVHMRSLQSVWTVERWGRTDTHVCRPAGRYLAPLQ